jgi:hypothetical protein
MCVDKSNFLPSLRQGDTRIEHERCFQRIEFDEAGTVRKKIYPGNPGAFKT